MEKSLNFASNEPLTTPDIKFKPSYARKLDFSLLCPNMEIQPQAPKNGIFQKNHFFKKVSRFRFQRALNHPQILSLSQVMQENMIMPKFSPSIPKMEFSKKIHFLKRSPDFASNEPSTTPDIKFKSSYARKHDFGLLYPNMVIRPQAPKNRIFQKKFIFLKRSSDFASNEPSTTCRHKV